MVNKELSGINEEVEIEDISEEEDLFPERYLISSYGADYVVDSLVKRIQSGDIYIPPFQRQFIWTQKQSSRFIESLLLGLPVPGIFLSKDDDTKKLVVIDGQQRLRSLQFFYEGIFANTGKQFTLSYGYVETSVRTILQEYTKNKSHQFISNFVEKRLEQFRNATMNNIKSLIQAFSQSWVESIIEDIDHEIIDAVNSLANNRHQIAHGKNTAVSFVYVKNWHTKSVDLIKYLEHLTNHE